jgi:hypothetical protein
MFVWCVCVCVVIKNNKCMGWLFPLSMCVMHERVMDNVNMKQETRQRFWGSK